MDNETCDVRRAECEVSSAEIRRDQEASSPPLLKVTGVRDCQVLPNLAPASEASARTSHPVRRLRRLRVGRDGIFPW